MTDWVLELMDGQWPGGVKLVEQKINSLGEGYIPLETFKLLNNIRTDK